MLTDRKKQVIRFICFLAIFIGVAGIIETMCFAFAEQRNDFISSYNEASAEETTAYVEKTITTAQAKALGYSFGYISDKNGTILRHIAFDDDNKIYTVIDWTNPTETEETVEETTEIIEEEPDDLVEITSETATIPETESPYDSYGTLISAEYYNDLVGIPNYDEMTNSGYHYYLWSPVIELSMPLSRKEPDMASAEYAILNNFSGINTIRDHVEQGFYKIKNYTVGDAIYVAQIVGSGTYKKIGEDGEEHKYTCETYKVKRYIVNNMECGTYGDYNYLAANGEPVQYVAEDYECNLVLMTCHNGGIYIVYAKEDINFVREEIRKGVLADGV